VSEEGLRLLLHNVDECYVELQDKYIAVIAENAQLKEALRELLIISEAYHYPERENDITYGDAENAIIRAREALG